MGGRAVLAVALGAVLLAGCSGDEPEAGPVVGVDVPLAREPSGDVGGSPEPAPPQGPDAGDDADPTATAGTAAPGTGGGTRAFVAGVRREVPEVAAGRTDAELVAVALQACEGLAAGTPADDLVEEVKSLGTADAEATDSGTARELVKLAIDTTCLDQAGRVDEF